LETPDWNLGDETGCTDRDFVWDFFFYFLQDVALKRATIDSFYILSHSIFAALQLLDSV
jgi:hypothetical protein